MIVFFYNDKAFLIKIEKVNNWSLSSYETSVTNVCHGTTIRDGVEKYLEFHFFKNKTNLIQQL